ncbi:MAG TPA: hypothetical protein VH590_19050, partial [Ktedonobacterales bacterium]
MQQDLLSWQAELFPGWKEGQTLAQILMSFDAQAPLGGLFGNLPRGVAPPEVAAEAVRRLAAVFQEQVDR